MLAVVALACSTKSRTSSDPTGPVITAPTTVALDESVTLVPRVKRLGLNLGGHNYWDQAQFLKSVINGNPGFEGITHNVTIRCGAGTAGSTCVQASLGPDPAWGDPGALVTGFWDGAPYEVIWGAAKGRAGTVTTHVGAPSGSSWLLGGTGADLAVGDYLVLRREYQGTGLESWWAEVSGGGTIAVETADLPPGTEGTQALRLDQLATGAKARLASYFDSGGAHPMLKLSGPYTLRFKAKVASGGDQLLVTVSHRLGLFGRTYTLTDTWQEYTGTFVAAEDGTVNVTGSLAVSPQGSSVILLDDLTLTRDLGDATNPTIFADSAVAALRAYAPGVLRYWGRQLGDTLDNQLATPYARRASGNSAWTVRGDSWEYGLHEFLQLCEVIGAEPWYVLPNSTSVAEAQHLMDYLGGAAGTPYGDRRIALGHAAPWTAVFDRIHLEFGNEQWNAIFDGIQWPIPYGERGAELFAAAKATPAYAASAATFDFVLGGQSGFLGRNQHLQTFFLVDGARRGLILYNLHRTSALEVAFSGVNPPRGTVSVRRLTGPAITSTNEAAEEVTVSEQGHTAFDPTASFSLPAHSMTVLSWTTDGSPP